jgi:5,5'-dehydrodivanillate O-demethylase
MLTTEQNERYTQVGPSTPCGDMMRRYWHPVAALSQMQDKSTMKVRLLGEDLVLYKDKSGTFGLIEPHCAHRRMDMIFGIPEDRGLRCPYHGWLYDETGQCTEQPYEETEDPQSRFKDKVKMKAYPVQHLSGLLFAYLGPAPAPLLPMWDVFTTEGVVRDIGYTELECNWLQCQENSLDPVHAEWLHVAWANYIREQSGEVGEMRTRRLHAKIDFDAFEYGIYKRRVYEGGSEDDTEYKEGHPIVFPNMLRQGTDGFAMAQQAVTEGNWATFQGPAFQIRTPIDDHTTGHWWIACYMRLPGETDQKPEEIPFYTPPNNYLDVQGQPNWDGLVSNSAQDPAAWVTQGPVVDRTLENLGRSDKGIILFRKMLDENIRTVEDGGDPICTFRDPDTNKYIPFVTEKEDFGATQVGGRQAAATYYSPILASRDKS